MAKFVVTVVDPKTGNPSKLFYDNVESTLSDETGLSVVQVMSESIMAARSPVARTSKSTPIGKTSPRVLKISLGLSCNYECEYCSQRFVPRSQETNPEDIQSFIDGLDSWITEPPEKVEFWGGEPLVYIKTLRPLAEAIRAKYPLTQFTMITNGSVLTPEINDWIEKMDFSIGLSHDGPGQAVRGPDPLADPDKKAAILDLYARLAPKGKMSFNTMMNRNNPSRAAVQQFFVALTGDRFVRIGEGGIVDAYDEGGVANSLQSHEFAAYRNLAFSEIRAGSARNFGVLAEKIMSFVNSLRTRRPISSVGQRCSMDKPDILAVDLRGNVLTCQNVSAVGMAPNGESHLLGTVHDLDRVKLNTATHFAHREECLGCPVVQICQGACMFLEGRLWDTTCNNAYSDAVPIFAAGIEFLTGLFPIHIEGQFRADRKDLFSNANSSPQSPSPKAFPIPVVAA